MEAAPRRPVVTDLHTPHRQLLVGLDVEQTDLGRCIPGEAQVTDRLLCRGMHIPPEAELSDHADTLGSPAVVSLLILAATRDRPDRFLLWHLPGHRPVRVETRDFDLLGRLAQAMVTAVEEPRSQAGQYIHFLADPAQVEA